MERTPAAFRKLPILEKITIFGEKALILATRQGYRRSANSARNCGDMCRKVKACGTRKRPKGELNHHNKGAEDEERGQLPSLKKKDYSQALLGPRKKQRADALKTKDCRKRRQDRKRP